MSKRLINKALVFNVVGTLIIIIGILMLLTIPFSLFYKDGMLEALVQSSIITLAIGVIVKYLTRSRKDDEVRKREGYLIVAFGWIAMILCSTLPYFLTNSIQGITNTFFETISGLTTTGSTILNNIEQMPESILFWRSMTQWIGGMGIIVLTIAILPLLGVGGMELFTSETPGPTKDKIHPRIKETAKRLWLIYICLTLLETTLLWFADMPLFDAINHALTNISTGGFSTKQASIGHFTSPLIQYIIIMFMFIGGINFTLLYFGAKLKFRKFIDNDEFKWFLYAIPFLLLIIFPIVANVTENNLETSFRHALFQIMSIMTGTGYSNADFTSWGAFATFIFFLLMFSGASAGSTTGGIKIVRIGLLIKNTVLEFKRRLHPNAIIPVHLNKMAVSPKTIYNLLAFIFFYLFIFVNSSIILTFIGLDFQDAIGASATAISNVGPGIGNLGPSSSFSHLPDSAKWVLSFLMILGRLELFTIAILFTPYFWKRN